MIGRKPQINLEVLPTPNHKNWIIREMGSKPMVIVGQEETKLRARKSAAMVAATYVRYVNKRTKQCEVYVRHLDGTWDRDTYGRDPRKSKN